MESESRRAYKREYYHRNKERIAKLRAASYLNHKEDYSRRWHEWRDQNVKSWEGFFPIVTPCQMCGVPIRYNCKDTNKSIHFDHTREDVPIKIRPSSWLVRNRRTPENEAIWKSCNFGMLCGRCNRRLPTAGREQFIKDVVRYWGHCRTNAEKVLIGRSYKLKEKVDPNAVKTAPATKKAPAAKKGPEQIKI